MKKKQIIVVLSLVGLFSSLNPGLNADAAWKADANGRYYTADNARGYLTGWQTIGKYKYYFTKSKYAATGWKKIKKYWYYFDAKGRMVTNTWIGNSYLTGSGRMAVNTVINGVQIDENGNRMTTGSNDSGSAGTTASTQKNTWVQEDGNWYYYDAKGNLAKGYLTIRNTTYYMDPDTGMRMGGVIKINNKYYYFDPQTGAQKTGYIVYNEKGYYFSKKTKNAVTGWNKINKKYYYFNKKGVLQRNKWISNKYYVDQLGRRCYGWLTINSGTYYLNPSTGIRTTGRVKIGNYYYYFQSNGKMYTKRWVKNQFYMYNGRMATKRWVKTQYVNASGYVSKTRSLGFYTDNKKTYYLQSNYKLAKNGWFLIDSKYYYFDAKGVMLSSTWQDGYYIDKNGMRVVGQFKTIDKQTYRFDSTGAVIKGFTSRDGKTYYMDLTTGAMKTGFLLIDGTNYYFDPSTGVMAVDQTMVINNSVYVFDKNGAGSLSASDYSLGQSIAEYAQQFVGYPYSYGGATDLTKGVDCSGFTMLVYKHFGLNIPRVAAAQALGTSAYGGPYAEVKFISESELLPGDIICYYSPVEHVGIYIGNGQIVHASNSQPYPAGGIKISPYNYTTITKIVRYW